LNRGVISIVAVSVLCVFLSGCSRKEAADSNYAESPATNPTAAANSSANSSTDWNRQAAANYLDQRAAWWIGWRGSARDHGTFCVSCHTSVPYVLSRPALRTSLGQEGLSPNERLILDDVSKRVRLWNDTAPYYTDMRHAAPSRSTEAVLNTFILASYDAQTGHLGDDTRTAFSNLWALQIKDGPDSGAWAWQDFNLKPWESYDSNYYGAALAAIAVGIAPDGYRSFPAIQQNIDLLKEYLVRDYASQSLLNQTFLLIASSKLPGLLTPDQQKGIIGELEKKQHPDGGWNLPSLASTWRGWNPSTLYSLVNRREDGSPQNENSDGDATGIVTYAMQLAGVSGDDQQLHRGLAWLISHQNSAAGSWHADSLNRSRDPNSNIGRFMSDEATGYAVLSLLANNPKPLAPAVSQNEPAPRTP